MIFGEAIVMIQDVTLSDEESNEPKAMGMRLPQWSEDVVIRVQKPDANSKMTAPYFYVTSRFGKVPWIPTMIEMFSNKWELVA